MNKRTQTYVFPYINVCICFDDRQYSHLSVRTIMAAMLQTAFSNTFSCMNCLPKFIPESRIDSIPSLFQVMIWCRKGDKSLVSCTNDDPGANATKGDSFKIQARFVYISVTKWDIVGCWFDAIWGLWDGFIPLCFDWVYARRIAAHFGVPQWMHLRNEHIYIYINPQINNRVETPSENLQPHGTQFEELSPLLKHSILINMWPIFVFQKIFKHIMGNSIIKSVIL